jgi:hypothetical protein
LPVTATGAGDRGLQLGHALFFFQTAYPVMATNAASAGNKT